MEHGVNREQSRQEAIAASSRAEAPVRADLEKAGFKLEAVSDLYRKKLNYRTVIPILLRWLPQMHDIPVKEDIVRALSVRWARPLAAGPLVHEYRKATPAGDFSLLWAIGNALAIVADDTVFDDVEDLIRDRRYGRAREMLAFALGNMRSPRTVDVLIEMLGDEEVAGQAIVSLGKMRAQQARSHIEPFQNHTKTWIRNAAKQAISRIDKSSRNQSSLSSDSDQDHRL